MNERARPVQRHGMWARVALVGALTTSAVFLGQNACADEPSQAALVAARELFREATQDADAQRYEVALEKFRRVAATKETAPVRFNIAKCEHALGKLGAALADYELAEREAAQEKKHDIAKMATKNAAALRTRVPRLTVTLAGSAPKDATVLLDGERVPAGSLGIGLPVDPGAHRIEASAPGHVTLKKELHLKEGDVQRVALELPAEAPATSAAALPEDAPEVKLALEQPAPSTTTPPKDDPGARHESGSGRKTWGWIVLGAGAALGAGSVVFWRMHESNVSDIEKLNAGCRASNTCGAAETQRGKDLQNKSDTNQTLTLAFGIGAGVALVAGVVLLVWPNKSASSTRITPAVGPGTAGLSASGAF